MDLVTPDVGLLFWTFISFAVLFFILKKFAWKHIVGAVDNREKSILDALASAEKAKKEMENLTADNERILKEARAEREKATADNMIIKAQEAINNEKKSAMADLKNQVASLSVDIAEKVVKEELSNKEKQLKLVEDMLDDATLN